MDRKRLLKNPSSLGGCVYYSQNREDLFLKSFFPDVKDGFYVDVGAFDPDIDSVTKLFYLQGWHGINIEPQPANYKKFQRIRKRDINLGIGVSDKGGELKLRAYRNGGLSTFSDTMKSSYEEVGDSGTDRFQEIVVPVRALREVFTENEVNHIHFLKVDVEGFEYEVLNGNDWTRYRPEVICIESNHIQRDWRPMLLAADYDWVFDDGLNGYYVDRKTDRKQKFNPIKDVINDRGGGIRADHFERMMALYFFGRDKAHHVEELAHRADDLQRTLDEVLNELRAYDSTKATARHLEQLIVRKLKVKRSK